MGDLMGERMSLELVSQSPQQTEAIGRIAGESLTSGSVVALIGTLGAGKTLFARGVAAGNKLPPDCSASSPTFALVNEYPGILTLFHLDAYRLSGALELDSLGFDEMCESGGAVIIEWADRVAESIPSDHLRIEFQVVDSDSRRITIAAFGQKSQAIADALRQSAGPG